ncbi:helix-turn-helix domain-containing protein [Halopseudomonas bauzanensis]|uniref:helix-turn-helix domain-containing protein n=1 Tax=Halopseudomonas bauzanensis TaxID=653930 RepID=UPI00255378A6|nr:helix-turn-helix transcriptional regulator [Halopseudomonas bauzanensis]
MGRTIRRLRKERGLTQAQLATQVGISRATVSGIENNTIAELGIRKYEKLLNALGHTLTVKPRSGRPTLDDLKERGVDDGP